MYVLLDILIEVQQYLQLKPDIYTSLYKSNTILWYYCQESLDIDIFSPEVLLSCFAWHQLVHLQ